MSEITLTLPSMIDGEPSEVAEQVTAGLTEVAPNIERYFNEAATQLRSSWMTKQLELEPTLDANQLAERWHRSGYSRKVASIGRAGRLVGVAVETLNSEGQ